MSWMWTVFQDAPHLILGTAGVAHGDRANSGSHAALVQKVQKDASSVSFGGTCTEWCAGVLFCCRALQHLTLKSLAIQWNDWTRGAERKQSITSPSCVSNIRPLGGQWGKAEMRKKWWHASPSGALSPEQRPYAHRPTHTSGSAQICARFSVCPICPAATACRPRVAPLDSTGREVRFGRHLSLELL